MSFFNWLSSLAQIPKHNSTHRKARPSQRTRLGVERLEDRTVPSFTASLTGGTLTFTSTTPNDKLVLFSDNNGNLEHNRSADPGFASAYDMDSTAGGVQGLSLANLTNLVINATGTGSSVDLTGLLYSGAATIQANSLSVAGDVNYVLTNTKLTLSNGGNYNLTGVTNVTLTAGSSNDTIDATAFSAGPVTLNGGTGKATLKGGSDGSTFIVGSSTNAIMGTGSNNTLMATGSGAITLTNSSLTIGGKVISLSGIQTADLTGGATATTFDVSGWTGGGTLKGTSGNDGVVCTADTTFVLSDGLLQLNSGPVYTLSGIENATLTGGPGDNTFSVHNWSGTDTLNGGGGTDTYLITLNASGTGNTTIANGNAVNATGSAFIFGPDTPSPITVGSATLTMGTQTVNFSGLNKFTVDGGLGADNISVQGSAPGTTVTIQSGAGNDSITVSSATGTLDTFQGPLVVDGGAGSNKLTVSEAKSTTPDTINFTGTQITSASRGFALSYTASNGTFANGLAMYLGSGNDTVNVSGTIAGASTFIKGGGGKNTFLVSNNAGDLTSLAGYLYLDGGSGSNTLTIDESAGTTSDVVAVTNAVIFSTSRPYAVYYGNSGGGNFSGGVNLKLDSSNNVVSIFSTIANAATVITTGAGKNSFYVNSITNTLSGFNGPLYLIAGSGTNSLLVTESGLTTGDTLTLGAGYIYSSQTSFSLNYGSSSTGSFANGISVVTGSGKNTIAIQGTQKNAPTYLFTGAGNDYIVAGSAQNTLDTFISTVIVSGGTGTNTLLVNDAGSTKNDNLTLALTYVAETIGSFALGFSGKFSSITVALGSGNDAISITGEPTGTLLTVNAGNGNNTFTVAVTTTTAYTGLAIYGGTGTNTLLIQAPGAAMQTVSTGSESGYVQDTYPGGATSYVGYRGISVVKRTA